MAFSARRGRPRSNTRQKDLGTPELRQKRQAGITAEPIDLCLQAGIITPKQHWCAIHFRWLYAMRYGVPGIQAVNPAHLAGRELSTDNSEWKEEREQEYRQAAALLESRGLMEVLLKICIYNEHPRWLYSSYRSSGSLLLQKERDALRDSLDILCFHWRARFSHFQADCKQFY